MSDAYTAYKVRVEKRIWSALGEDKETIIAMQAEIAELKDKRLKLDTKSRAPVLSSKAYAVHQCACFCSEPKEEHVKDVMHLGKYLQGTKEQGIIIKPDKQKSFEVWVDADYSGNWNKTTAQHDVSTAKSRSGYVMTYGNCPIF